LLNFQSLVNVKLTARPKSPDGAGKSAAAAQFGPLRESGAKKIRGHIGARKLRIGMVYLWLRERKKRRWTDLGLVKKEKQLEETYYWFHLVQATRFRWMQASERMIDGTGGVP
jgi:hypothetical protein